MIDWLKATALIDAADSDSLQNRFDFKSKINERTGELTEWPKQYQYANLNFVLVPAQKQPGYWLELSGSLHKFWEGKTNYQPFSFKDVCYTIEFLAFVCQIDHSAFTIRQLEFGVNLTAIPFETKELFTNLIAYKNKTFGLMRTKRSKCIGSCATLNDYEVKIYDKQLQYTLPFAVVRIEMHVHQHVGRMLGIETLADLTNRIIVTRLECELRFMTSNLVFDDPTININLLRPTQQEFLTRGRNPRYYGKFTLDERKRFKRLIQRYGICKYEYELSRMVIENWQMLSDIKSCD